MVADMAATCAIPLSKWLVFIRPSLAGFDCPLTIIQNKFDKGFAKEIAQANRVVVHESIKIYTALLLNRITAQPLSR